MVKKKGKKARISRRQPRKLSVFSIFRWLLLLIFLLFIFAGTAVLYIYWRYAADLPALYALNDYKPPVITNIYDVRGRLIGEFYEERRIVLEPDEIPSLLRQAVIAIEDRNFYRHKGVDYRGILRAAYINLRNFEFSQGGSTIPMQVARTFLLTHEKTFTRKIKEALLALRIERNFSKQEILALYLNQIYLGHGTYGIAAAAEGYFGKKVEELTLAECALLAGLPQKPSKLDPFRYPEAALERREKVLHDMLELGMVSDEEHKAALAEKPKLVKRINPTHRAAPYFVEHVRKYLVEHYNHETVYRQGLSVFTTVDLEWTDAAYKALRKGLRRQDRIMGWRGPIRHLEGQDREEYLAQLRKKYAKKPAKGATVEAIIIRIPGKSASWAVLKIGDHTARLPAKGKKWIKALNTQPHEKLKNIPKPRNKLKPGDLVKVLIKDVDSNGTLVVGLEQDPMVQGAILTIDPYTGEVRTMVGGRDFTESEFNRAVQAKRQPGSAFKPFLYTAAIKAGYTPASVIIDTPIILEGPRGPWKPRNYGGKFSGPRTLASALQYSVNTISVKLMQNVGVNLPINIARKMGITSKLNADLSLALGTPSLTILELTRAYGVFATEGKLVPHITVRRVYDRDGRLLEDRVPRVEGLSSPPQDLAEFIEWSAREPEPFKGSKGMKYRMAVGEMRGRQVLSPQIAYVTISLLRNIVERDTGRWARIKGLEIAGKTGTTNDYKDALFVGFTSALVTAVWVGHDSGRLSLGKGASGGDVAAPIWQNCMCPIVRGQRIPPFPRPEGVVTYTFDCINGTLPGPTSEKICRAAFLEGTSPPPYVPPPEDDIDIFQDEYLPPDELPY